MDALFASFKEYIDTLPQEKSQYIADHGFGQNEDIYSKLRTIMQPHDIFQLVPYLSEKGEDMLTNIFVKFIDHFTNIENSECSVEELLQKCKIKVEEKPVEQLALPDHDNVS